MCVQSFHMVNIDVPAGVGAPPLDTQLSIVYTIGNQQFVPYSEVSLTQGLPLYCQ